MNQSFCPPGTFNDPDNPSPRTCNYFGVEGDDPCPYDDGQPNSNNVCQAERNSESQCWGSAVDNGAGQCITDTRTLSCDSGEQGSPSTDGSSLICSTPGEDVPRTVSCNEGEQGSATGGTLTCPTPGQPVDRTVSCNEGEQGISREPTVAV